MSTRWNREERKMDRSDTVKPDREKNNRVERGKVQLEEMIPVEREEITRKRGVARPMYY